MKRFILAGLIGGSVFATVLGLAAALIVTGGGAQSGEANAECDSDGVSLTWQNTNADPDYEQATVAGISGCSGTLDVSVIGHTGGHFVVAQGQTTGTQSTVVVTLTEPLSNPGDVFNLEHTHVTIVQTGP